MYLLIDRFDTRGPMSTLFTEPNEDGTFKHTDAAPFGKPLALPAPFDVSIPTEESPGAVTP
ncbi:Putative restriction endonuclease domain-containing protein OS=Streptomyces microflavus OX=1919 GN=Smic_45040 PE=4 SV=1 [Streptomyces microflavus]